MRRVCTKRCSGSPTAVRASGAVPGHWYVDLQNEELPPAPTKSQRKQVERAAHRAAAAGKNKKAAATWLRIYGGGR